MVLPIAETTTSGLRLRRARMISATRSIEGASSTEVPPNFITIIVGSGFRVPGSWFRVCGFWFLVCGSVLRTLTLNPEP